jgi:hypothetical protein
MTLDLNPKQSPSLDIYLKMNKSEYAVLKVYFILNFLENLSSLLCNMQQHTHSRFVGCNLKPGPEETINNSYHNNNTYLQLLDLEQTPPAPLSLSHGILCNTNA